MTRLGLAFALVLLTRPLSERGAHRSADASVADASRQTAGCESGRLGIRRSRASRFANARSSVPLALRRRPAAARGCAVTLPKFWVRARRDRSRADRGMVPGTSHARHRHHARHLRVWLGRGRLIANDAAPGHCPARGPQKSPQPRAGSNRRAFALPQLVTAKADDEMASAPASQYQTDLQTYRVTSAVGLWADGRRVSVSR